MQGTYYLVSKEIITKNNIILGSKSIRLLLFWIKNAHISTQNYDFICIKGNFYHFVSKRIIMKITIVPLFKSVGFLLFQNPPVASVGRWLKISAVRDPTCSSYFSVWKEPLQFRVALCPKLTQKANKLYPPAWIMGRWISSFLLTNQLKLFSKCTVPSLVWNSTADLASSSPPFKCAWYRSLSLHLILMTGPQLSLTCPWDSLRLTVKALTPKLSRDQIRF